MALVLVVEDDLDIAETLELYLRNDQHQTERARDGHTALQLFRAAQPDLVLLDIGLPQLDGLEVLKAIRAESNVPVIMLTARAEDVDELLGLELGADDYVAKPYSPRKLMARVKAVLRRAATAEPDALVRVGRVEVDSYRVRARVDGRELHLTPTEFKLLAQLAAAPGKATSRTARSRPPCRTPTPSSGRSTFTSRMCAANLPRSAPPRCWRRCAASATDCGRGEA